MQTPELRGRLVRRLGDWSCLAAAAMGACTLWSWGAGVGDLFSRTGNKVPSATTAFCFVLLGLTGYARSRQSSGTRFQRLVLVAAGLAALAGVSGLSPAWRTLPNITEVGTVTRQLGFVASILAERMSPLAGLILILGATSLALHSTNERVSAWVRRVAGCLATGVALVGAGVATSYGLGSPMLTTWPSNPMSEWTAFTALVLGIGLGITAILPPRSNAPARSRSNTSGLGHPLTLSALLAAAISVVGALYLRSEQRELRDEAYELLKAIGDMKTSELVGWREERMNDARFFAHADFVSRDIQAFFDHPESEQTSAEVTRWFALLKGGDRYSLVALFDQNGTPRLSVPSLSHQSPEALSHLKVDASQAGATVMTDLHLEPGSGEVHLDILFPVVPFPSEPTARTSTNSPALATVLVRIDPRRFLYPLLQTWPTPSRTAETVLIRREGDDILFLNELRHRTNTALTFSLSIGSHPGTPGVLAAQGVSGEMQGPDYRDVPVVAAVRPVPGSPWFLIAKMDRDELYGPLHVQAWLSLGLTIVLAGSTGLLGRLFWERRETIFTRQELAAERQRLALANRVELLLKSAHDVILLADAENWRILEANDRAVQTYAYSVAEIRALRLQDLRAPEHRASFDEQVAAFKTAGSEVLETIHQRRDGSTFPVELSSRLVAIDGASLALVIVRDLTQRKTNERRIDEQLDELRRWQTVTLGRERRILELKHEVNTLHQRLDESPRYTQAEPAADTPSPSSPTPS